jgi:uncharacterized small protein (DUF1192 family)
METRLNAWARVRAARADLRAARARGEQLLGVTAELQQRIAELTASVAAMSARLEQSEADRATAETRRTVAQQRMIHALRMIRDGDPANWNRLWELRAEDAYERAFTEPEPLVSIIVPTYDNWKGLRDRALPAVLAQSYENWECVIVGDAAPPQTAEVVASFGDTRLRYVNLPYRGPYPDDREDAWLISGTNPINTAMRLAEGHWIGTTADDDALLPTAIESLLTLAREQHAEVTYGTIRVKYPDRPDALLGVGPPPRVANWGLQASLFHAGLRFVPLLYSDWLFSTAEEWMPNDWSWGERLLRIGVRFAMLQEPVVEYYPSKVWKA